MVMTIAEERRIWKKTGGNPNPDVKVLLEKLVETRADICFTTPDFSQTTFHPLGIPNTIGEAVQKYVRDGVDAVDPMFVDLVDKVEKYNRGCNYENHMERIDEIEVQEYVNFLYLASEVIKGVPYHNNKKFVRKIWDLLRKKLVEVEDTNPIVVVTNPEEDELIECFKDDLMRAAVDWNRGLRIIHIGDNQAESLRDFYFNPEIKDFDYVHAEFKNDVHAYSGIWTKDCGVKVMFNGEKDLLGLGNKVEGRMQTGVIANVHYEIHLNAFNGMKKEHGIEKS